MQNYSKVFKSKFDYYQRVAHKKLLKKNVLLNFSTSLFPAGAPFSDKRCYSRFSLVEQTKTLNVCVTFNALAYLTIKFIIIVLPYRHNFNKFSSALHSALHTPSGKIYQLRVIIIF